MQRKLFHALWYLSVYWLQFGKIHNDNKNWAIFKEKKIYFQNPQGDFNLLKLFEIS